MKKYVQLTVSLLVLAALPLSAEAQIGMGGAAHPSAALDIKSTTRAFYPPRLTTAARVALVNPQVGALVFDTEKGSMYLYDGNNWVMLTITPPDAQQWSDVLADDNDFFDRFGVSVSIAGDYAIIGANEGTGNAALTGCAYVFLRSGSTWAQQAKLIAADGVAADVASFGESVSISGDVAVVGAPKSNIGVLPNQGAAYVFVRSGTTWTQQAKLTATDGAATDEFGISVAIDGDYTVNGIDNRKKG
jgi:hypothetical protein